MTRTREENAAGMAYEAEQAKLVDAAVDNATWAAFDAIMPILVSYDRAALLEELNDAIRTIVRELT